MPRIAEVQIRRQVRAVILFICLILEVEVPGPIGTGDNAVPAANAAAEVLHYNAISPLVGRLRWANIHTGRMLAVHAGHGDYLGIYGWIFTLGDRNNLVPVQILTPLPFMR
jgi:hypothetical protein